MKPIQVGLLGIGTVGSGVFNVLDRRYWEWGDVYGRSPDDPSLPLLARAGRYLSVNMQLTF